MVSSIRGELTDVLARHDCGRSYRSDSVAELAQALRELQAEPEKTRAMGVRARQLLEAEYSTERIFARLETHLQRVLLARRVRS